MPYSRHFRAWTVGLLWLLLAGLSACQKEDKPEPSLLFTPTSGSHSTWVTVTGAAFSSVPAENQVTFNGVPARVESASSTELVVQVPVGALSGPVAVQVAGHPQAKSRTAFRYLYSATVSTFPQQPYAANPAGVATDAQGNLYVANEGYHCVLKITPQGVVTTLAGESGSAGHVDGPAALARFAAVTSLAVDQQGNVYVAEKYAHYIRKISAAGVVSTLAGSGVPGYWEGVGPSTRLNMPDGLAVDAQGNVLFADQGNDCIRQISPAGVVSTFAGLGARGGFADGPPGVARFYSPTGIAIDAQGVVYVADAGNHRIRKIARNKTVTTLGGSSECGYRDGPVGTSRFYYPTGVAVGADSSVYIAEHNGNRIRLLAADGYTSTLAGPPSNCLVYIRGSLVNGPGGTARFDGPRSIALGPKGELYVADDYNYCIRKLILQ